FEAVREGFFQKKVATGARTSQRDGNVQAAGVGDESDIGAFRERGLKSIEGANIVFLLDVPCTIDLQSGRDHVGETTHAVGQDFNRVSQQRSQVAYVALPNSAQADD